MWSRVVRRAPGEPADSKSMSGQLSGNPQEVEGWSKVSM